LAGHRAEQVERVADTAGNVEEDVVYYIAAGVAFVVEETVDVGAAAVEGVVSEADVAVAVAAEAGVVEADVSEVDVAEIGANLVYVAVWKIVSVYTDPMWDPAFLGVDFLWTQHQLSRMLP